ncbi:MAG: T9SS type A sorting domain-containing protein [Chitinophagaceae bacterium]
MEKIYTSCVAAFYCIVSFLLGLFTKVKNNWLGKPAILLLLFAFSSAAFNDAHADVTITTSPVTAGGVNQGSNNNLIYVAQVAVTTNPVVVNNIQFTLGGTHDGSDLSTVLAYYNSSSPDFAGSSFLGSAVAGFAAPHTYSINVSRSITAGSTGYFIIVANVNSGATDNNTIKINGATNPVVFGFTTSPVVTNNQSDLAGLQTIQAADITVTTSPVTAAGINQGSNNNIIYIAQVAVATNPADVSNVQFTLSGTHDANDLSTVLVYFNSSSPSFAGSSFLGSALASFAAPHTYSINLSRNLPAGSTGYFIIVANVNSGATDNNTVKINGATNPVIFGFATSPNITNTQTDAAGTQTIQASDITLNTSPTASSPFPNGSNNNIVYIAQMSVATMPVLINNIQFTLSGTHDADDLTTVNVYFNGSAPAFAGSSFLGSAVTSFAGPHTYSINISRNMDAGTTGYYVIIVNVDPLATLGNTVTINGAANPVVFGFATSPNITNNQVNNAGLHTLPVTFISVNAQTAAAGVAITWKTANELNIEKYIIERSADGTSFRAIGETMAIGGSNSIEYQFTDRAAFAGKNFYRIRAVNLDGRTELSPTVTFNIDGGTAGISIYPNPVVKNQLLTLSLQNIPRGNYSVRIQNAQGQLLQQQTIVQENGNSVQTIVLANTAAGIYTIEVSNHHQRFVKRFMTK